MFTLWFCFPVLCYAEHLCLEETEMISEFASAADFAPFSSQYTFHFLAQYSEQFTLNGRDNYS